MIAPIMGIYSYHHDVVVGTSNLADALFSSVQQRVLGLLFTQPDRRFQGVELIRLANSGTGAVHRLTTRLAESGLITVTKEGAQKYYQANKASPIFQELRGLITKTCGLAEPLRKALIPFAGKIKQAFIYGSIAKGTETAQSDVDLMVISDTLSYAELYDALSQVEEAISRTINPTMMTPSEWEAKKSVPDSFAAKVAAQATIPLIGANDEH